MPDKTGVLVVDDSAFMRKVISDVLNESDDFAVVAVARNGSEALQVLEDKGQEIALITLDIQMPVMDGLSCLKQIMSKHPRRVVMVSSLTTEGAVETLEALDSGAVDFFAKPGGAIDIKFKDVAPRLLEVLRTAVKSRLGAPAKRPVPSSTPPPASQPFAPAQAKRTAGGTTRLVAVASSTGGPKALGEFVPELKAGLDACVLVVQHMPANFTRLLADRLNSRSKLLVKEAEEGDLLEHGKVLIAPGGMHVEITKDRRIHLTKDPPVGGLRPCADVTFRTLAPIYGQSVVGVVLTGMGHDGREGCTLLKQRGCAVLAESRETATIYGMPKAVVDAKLADRVLPIQDMARAVEEEVARL